jgi:hypothetical protein
MIPALVLRACTIHPGIGLSTLFFKRTDKEQATNFFNTFYEIKITPNKLTLGIKRNFTKLQFKMIP